MCNLPARVLRDYPFLKMKIIRVSLLGLLFVFVRAIAGGAENYATPVERELLTVLGGLLLEEGTTPVVSRIVLRQELDKRFKTGDSIQQVIGLIAHRLGRSFPPKKILTSIFLRQEKITISAQLLVKDIGYLTHDVVFMFDDGARLRSIRIGLRHEAENKE